MKKVKSKVDPLLIHLIEMRVVKVTLNNSISIQTAEELYAASEIEIQLESGLFEEEKIFRHQIKVTIQPQDSKGKHLDLFFEMMIDFFFRVDNLEELLQRDQNEQYIVDGTLGATLAGLSYSTARGIIYTRTLGTSMNGFILPVIPPQNIINGYKTVVK